MKIWLLALYINNLEMPTCYMWEDVAYRKEEKEKEKKEKRRITED